MLLVRIRQERGLHAPSKACTAQQWARQFALPRFWIRHQLKLDCPYVGAHLLDGHAFQLLSASVLSEDGRDVSLPQANAICTNMPRQFVAMGWFRLSAYLCLLLPPTLDPFREVWFVVDSIARRWRLSVG